MSLSFLKSAIFQCLACFCTLTSVLCNFNAESGIKDIEFLQEIPLIIIIIIINV